SQQRVAVGMRRGKIPAASPRRERAQIACLIPYMTGVWKGIERGEPMIVCNACVWKIREPKSARHESATWRSGGVFRLSYRRYTDSQGGNKHLASEKRLQSRQTLATNEKAVVEVVGRSARKRRPIGRRR